jgi:hypothetical protein
LVVGRGRLMMGVVVLLSPVFLFASIARAMYND